MNFQAPIVYGAFNVPDNFEPDFQVPWPAPGGIADMQGGMNRVRLPDGTLNHFTAASGVEIYRGHRLPKDMVGDLFFTEPVGRIVRRAKVVVTRRPDAAAERLSEIRVPALHRSPVPSGGRHNAPDGSLLRRRHVHRHHPGCAVRRAEFVPAPQGRAVQARQAAQLGPHLADHPRGHDARPHAAAMYSETPAQLVKHLEHANGWWRDTAQKLLVLQQRQVAWCRRCGRWRGAAANQLARIHALWTLEGLQSLDAALARELMKSPDPQIRIQAIRASETLYKAGDKSFADDYQAMLEDRDPNVVIQAMLTLNLHKIPGYDRDDSRRRSPRATVRGVKEIGTQILKPSSVARAAAVARRHGGQRVRTSRPISGGRCGAARRSTRSSAPPVTAPDGTGRADGRGAGGHAAGAAAGRLAARRRTPRLRRSRCCCTG